jgi:hypothetical protein
MNRNKRQYIDSFFAKLPKDVQDLIGKILILVLLGLFIYAYITLRL